jgi:putative cardiolipin synthase
VRLLVDDLKFRSRTSAIASLCLHPNLEIKVFNPFTTRSNAVTQGLEFARRFAKLDQRMHNKLLVADTERAIFGGRNVASEHFGLHKAFNYVDFDVELAGPDVSDLANVFKSYWNNPISVAGASLDESVSEADLESTRAFIANELENREPVLTSVLEEEERWPRQERLVARSLRPGAITVASDTPGVSQGSRPVQVHEALHRAADAAEHDIVIATPFFVPSETHVEWYQQLVDRGVRFRILTNSLASNPGTISNSGLNKQRMSVVKAGVELHELRTDAAIKPEWEIPPVTGRYLALHAKLYVIDRKKLFLGSINLDPRSKFINTEMGVLIDDPRLAEDAADAIVPLLAPENSWRVDVGPDGELRWQSDTETLGRQPARNPVQRTADWIFSRLPIGDYI